MQFVCACKRIRSALNSTRRLGKPEHRNNRAEEIEHVDAWSVERGGGAGDPDGARGCVCAAGG